MGGLVWLASYPKSGNTWMRSFLHNLFLNPAEPVSINEMMAFCVSEPAATHYLRRVGKPWNETTPEDVMKVRAAVHADFTFASPDSVFVKTHNYLGDFFGRPLINMNVTAGAIYMVRNPLDVVLSARKHFNRTTDETIEMMSDPRAGTSLSASQAPEIFTSWSNHVRSWTTTPSPGLLVLRYEDMLSEPEKTFGTVARFLGLNPPEERLKKAIHFSSFKVLKDLEEKGGFLEKPEHADAFFRKGQIGQWREDLTDAQVRRIISDHREQMERFGYIPEDYA